MSRWSLSASTARWHDEHLAATVELLRPAKGLHELSLSGVAVPAAEFLGIELLPANLDELSPTETYARGDDLVATYLQTAARPFRLQAYWRRLRFQEPTCGECEGFELQVSINTSLLDTRPAVEVTSAVSAGEVATGDDALLIRPAAAPWSLFTMVHPHDPSVSSFAIGSDDRICIRQRLFGGQLEKGVILRARVRAIVLPRDDDQELARRMSDDFVRSPLPLTT